MLPRNLVFTENEQAAEKLKRSREQGRRTVFAALFAKGIVFLLIQVGSGLKRIEK
jgi:hypothetical protein